MSFFQSLFCFSLILFPPVKKISLWVSKGHVVLCKLKNYKYLKTGLQAENFHLITSGLATTSKPQAAPQLRHLLVTLVFLTENSICTTPPSWGQCKLTLNSGVTNSSNPTSLLHPSLPPPSAIGTCTAAPGNWRVENNPSLPKKDSFLLYICSSI